ncbi:DUF4112 domain-containing protein [Anabaena sp. PCC 7108]|uniref:DUF4112 domain-containing protein n=1 Tax=Anabaena sp. PCC 7108 TaxID=163908 RepID=UPI000346EBDD|nr:DUF4112 domain-containing protein [Anabaena sp. PCC 7108]
MENETNTSVQKTALSSANQEILKELHQLAKMMDSAFEIPVIRKSLGAEAVAGLVLPGFGDIITILPSLYIIWRAKMMGLPNDKIIPMFSNIALDTGVGLVPIVGDLFDFFWKANIKNINIIHTHFNLPFYNPNRKQSQIDTVQPQILSADSEPQVIVKSSPTKKLPFEQWLKENPVMVHFTSEEQNEAYQEYLSQNNH